MSKTNDRNRRLVSAAQNGLRDVAAMLMENGAEVMATGDAGETGLHAAAGAGQTEMIEYLLPLMEDIDVRDDLGTTPLGWAARRHMIDAVSLLLARGADPRAVDNEGRTSLHLAVAACTEITEDDPIHEEPEVLKALADGGADIDAKDRDGNTPLHTVAGSGNIALVKMLLGLGAAVDPVSASLETPLHLACEHSHKEIVKLLLEQGAAVDGKDSAGRSPLHRHLGSPPRRREIVGMLVDRGANVNATDGEGRTVLEVATSHNPRDPLGELLRKQGAVG